MKGKGILSIALIIALVFLISVVYLGTSRNKYEKISEETKAKLVSIINESKDEAPDLQTDSCNAEWAGEAHAKQQEMMGTVLNTVTIVGEVKNGKPNKYIIASFKDNMQLCIPYKEKNPHRNIILEADGHYFLATASKADVVAIVNYMEKQGVLNGKLP